MEENMPRICQPLVKLVIGLAGLCYFFITNDEVWGEAIGLTLFFASGQLQTVVKPPLSGKMLGAISSDDLLETWRIMIGIAPCMYYFYFVMYLKRYSTIYTSTICLSLLWESQIVDDLVNLLSYWLSYDLATVAKSFTRKILSMKEKSVKAFARNIVQDFLCVLCKLYKHSIMNFTKMNCFLLSQVDFASVTTSSLLESEMRNDITHKELLTGQIQKEVNTRFCTDLPLLKKECHGKIKERNPSRNSIIHSKLRMRNGYYKRQNCLTPSIPFTSSIQKSRNPLCSDVIRKQGIRIPVF